MLHETKAKTLLKKIIRKALLDPNIAIIVRDEEGERMNKKVKDIKEIIDHIFSVDVSEIYFANDYTENLINEFI